MTRLTILYDPDCFLCANSRRWMQDQETDFELGFIPLYDPEIRRRYPGFRPSPGELTAIREDGAAYLGSSAWLACLYAVADTRDLALRLSDSGLAFLARTAFRILTEKRPWIPRWLAFLLDPEWPRVLRGGSPDAEASASSFS